MMDEERLIEAARSRRPRVRRRAPTRTLDEFVGQERRAAPLIDGARQR
jgi:hypothetical protein